MTLNQSSPFPCYSPLPSETCRTPGLFIPWCRLSASSFIRLVYFFTSFTALCKLVLARPDGHEIWPYHCSLRSSRDICVVQLLVDVGTYLISSTLVFPWDVLVYLAVRSHFYGLYSSFGDLLWGSAVHTWTGSWMWQGSASVVSWGGEKYFGAWQ